MKSTWAVPRNLWKGGDVWIIGGGPSIPVQFGIPDGIVQQVVSGGLAISAYSTYMEPIHLKHTIGINVAYMLGNWLDMVFFGDPAFFMKHKDKLYEFQGLKVSCANVTASYPFVKFLGRDNRKQVGITKDPRLVSWNQNSGAAAISVAANAGAKRIFLLGFDMNLGAKNEQHWHSVYRDPSIFYQPKKNAKDTFNRHLKGFLAIARDARERGIEIINVSPTSAIEQFKKVSLKEALEL